MDRELPRPGEKYLHFKNKLYQILCVAEHTETGEKMVVYQALYGAFACYIRPLEMFMGEVDREKYPEVYQKYRFERVKDMELQKESEEAEYIPKTEIIESEKPQMLQRENVEDEPKHSDSDILQSQPKKSGGIESVHPVILQDKRETADTSGFSSENQEEEQADPALLRFLDADTLEEKYQILKSMERSITHRLIDDFSAVLDLVIPEGSLDFRYHQLLSSIGTMQRYENTRLR